ncbi:MAG: uroporphyrinogen-III synthase [Pseudomonadota bacterium]
MTGNQVIVTRAQPGAGQTIERLDALGISAICSPMLELAQTDIALPALNTVSGVLFTSANGVRFFAEVSDRRDLVAWCVGPATFDAAGEAGFSDCRNADGDGVALAEHVIQSADPAAGQLLHVANADARGDVAEKLTAAGYAVVFVPLYRAVPALELSFEARRALQAEKPAIVAVHSAKGAAAFASAAHDLEFGHHAAVAVSEKAAAPLRTLGFESVLAAEAPNEDALLRMITSVRAML